MAGHLRSISLYGSYRNVKEYDSSQGNVKEKFCCQFHIFCT